MLLTSGAVEDGDELHVEAKGKNEPVRTGRGEESRARLAEAEELVDGTGARFYERVIREAKELDS
jgi:hypothetical protein